MVFQLLVSFSSQLKVAQSTSHLLQRMGFLLATGLWLNVIVIKVTFAVFGTEIQTSVFSLLMSLTTEGGQIQ